MQQPSVVLTSLRAATMQPGTDPFGLIDDAAIVLTFIGAVIASIWPASAASRVDPVTVIGP